MAMRAMLKWLRDNGLSIAFFTLFVLCLAGQASTGHFVEKTKHPGSAPDTITGFVGGPEFLKGVFGNWQAALLQLFVLIVFAVFLRQRGASHSRKPEDEEKAEKGQQEDKGLIRRGGSWLWCNSLSVAFGALFAAAFVAFFFADFAATQSRNAEEHQPAFTLLGFLGSPQFWFDVFQTWQAEFFAMGVFLILSIFLRQENSAESKPIWAPDEDTGDTNE